MFGKSLPSVFVIAVLLSAGASCSKNEPSAPKPAVGNKVQPSETPPVVAPVAPVTPAASAPRFASGVSDGETSAACAAKLAALAEVRKRIPLLFIDLQRPLSAIEVDIKRAILLAESVIDGDTCKDLSKSDKAGVMALVARDYLSLLERHVAQYKSVVTADLQASGLGGSDLKNEIAALVVEERETYLMKIRNYSDQALKDAAIGSEARYQALATAADISEKDFNFNAQIDLVQKILVEYPESEHRSKWLIDVGKGHQYMARYQKAVDWLREVVSKHKSDLEYVAYNGLLFEALNGIGDLDGMETLMRGIQKEYPERWKSVKSPRYLDQYHQFYDVSNFWIGFVLYSKGDIPGAKKAFTECLNHLEQRTLELAKENKSLPAVQKIFLDFRVRDFLLVLEKHQGQKPKVSKAYENRLEAADLTAGVLWLTDNKVTLDKSEGRVVPIMFRLPGDRRSKTFYSDLDDLSKIMPTVDAVNLAFLPSSASEAMIQTRFDKMRVERNELDISMACGYDKSQNQALFRSLHGTVGTASFVVFDKEGKLAWYLADPKDMDRAILRRVLERLANG